MSLPYGGLTFEVLPEQPRSPLNKPYSSLQTQCMYSERLNNRHCAHNCTNVNKNKSPVLTELKYSYTKLERKHTCGRLPKGYATFLIIIKSLPHCLEPFSSAHHKRSCTWPIEGPCEVSWRCTVGPL